MIFHYYYVHFVCVFVAVATDRHTHTAQCVVLVSIFCITITFVRLTNSNRHDTNGKVTLCWHSLLLFFRSVRSGKFRFYSLAFFFMERANITFELRVARFDIGCLGVNGGSLFFSGWMTFFITRRSDLLYLYFDSFCCVFFV